MSGEDSVLPLIAVVFSLHPAVHSTLYGLGASASPRGIELAQRLVYADHLVPDDAELLRGCRRLLYEVYHDELQWSPNADAHTQFALDHDNSLFMDRYDESAVWIAVFSPTHGRVVACARLIAGALAAGATDHDLPDLDMLGYELCPNELRDWVRDIGAANVSEGQRLAVAKEFRSLNMPLHMYHLGALPFIDPAWDVLYAPEGAMFISVGHRRMHELARLIGGTDMKDAEMRYEPDSEALPIVTFANGNVPADVSAQLQRLREQEQKMRPALPLVPNAVPLPSLQKYVVSLPTDPLPTALPAATRRHTRESHSLLRRLQRYLK